MEEKKELKELKELKEFHYDFGVYPLTEEEADELFGEFIEAVEKMSAYLGGGYREYSEEDSDG